MGQRPEKEKRRKVLEEAMSDGLFADVPIPDVSEDPIFKMRKYTAHFRLMVLTPQFEMIRPGQSLFFGSDPKRYPNGKIDEWGRIQLPDGSTVPSLTAFNTAVAPSDWYHTEKGGTISRTRPDGWSRTYTTVVHSSETVRVEDLLFQYHDKLMMSVEELSNLEYLYSEMERQGWAKALSDLGPDLKAWRTRQSKLKSRKQQDKTGE